MKLFDNMLFLNLIFFNIKIVLFKENLDQIYYFLSILQYLESHELPKKSALQSLQILSQKILIILQIQKHLLNNHQKVFAPQLLGY